MASYTTPWITPPETSKSTQFSLSISTVNYADTPPNILEYYSSDLEGYRNFVTARNEFNTMTFHQFLETIPAEAKHLFDPLKNTLSAEEQTLSIVQLVKSDKIHWGGDNQTEDRPNAIRHSGTFSRAFTFEEVCRWYSDVCSQYDEDLKKEATKYLDGNIELVKIGIMVYDVLCNHIYQKHSLSNVRTQMRRETEEDENLYQFQKFKTIIAPQLNSNDIVAVQESLDFHALKTTSWCFKTYAMPSGKTAINGTPGSKISILLNSSVAKHTKLLDTPTISEHMYLKKTSCFSVKIRGKHVLLVVLHMKNPKKDAPQVSTDLKTLIQHLKGQTSEPYDYDIVIGDTNLEAKNKFTPADMATSLGLKKVDNICPTTSKKRTWAQGQAEKAETESLEEKDACLYSDNLTVVQHTLQPEEPNTGTNSIYPNLSVSYLPKPSWPSDHLALSVLFQETPKPTV